MSSAGDPTAGVVAKLEQPNQATEVSKSVQPVSPAETPTKLSELGQAGDAFGGINALFASVGGALLFWAGWLQRKALIEARAVNAKVQFETIFFELLSLIRDLENRFETSRAAAPRRTLFRLFRQPESARGHDALSEFADYLFKYAVIESGVGVEKSRVRLSRLVTFFHDSIYSSSPGAFGPYFRALFQIFKHIDKSSLGEEEKTQFANIARGQITEHAVLLLAFNGLGPYGDKFIPYIERYGLLEHMAPLYRTSLRELLLTAYQPHAFLGSVQRRKARFVNIDRIYRYYKLNANV